ncbi:hypothetical protein [Tropicibacter sp. S64]|uniref:hypothetical protein n=1 Tax=Tropicibacter sp. S64 TaxID=3415122 RepID=UPI003C7A91F6
MIRLLQTPLTDLGRLPAFVEDCAMQGCIVIAVWGDDADAVHDEIDDLLLFDFDAGKPRQEPWSDIVTTLHPDHADALELAQGWDGGIHSIEDMTL